MQQSQNLPLHLKHMNFCSEQVTEFALVFEKIEKEKAIFSEQSQKLTLYFVTKLSETSQKILIKIKLLSNTFLALAPSLYRYF